MKIPLGHDRFALVDDDQQELLAFRWYAAIPGGRRVRRQIYAITKMTSQDGPKRGVLMHRYILGAPAGLMVDHINGDTLDNRRWNLRLVTRIQNGQNRIGASAHSKTGVRGVFLLKTGGYRAEVRVANKRVFSKRFTTVTEAEQAVIEARRQLMTHSSECTRETRQRV